MRLIRSKPRKDLIASPFLTPLTNKKTALNRESREKTHIRHHLKFNELILI